MYYKDKEGFLVLLSYHGYAFLRTLVGADTASFAVGQIDFLRVLINNRIRAVHGADAAVVADGTVDNRTERSPRSGLSHGSLFGRADGNLRNSLIAHA